MKPSERIKEIHRALKILDGQDPESIHFNNISFIELAILQYLDELKDGTALNQRGIIPKTKE